MCIVSPGKYPKITDVQFHLMRNQYVYAIQRRRMTIKPVFSDSYNAMLSWRGDARLNQQAQTTQVSYSHETGCSQFTDRTK